MTFFIWLNRIAKILNQILNMIIPISGKMKFHYSINRNPIPKAFNGFELRLVLIIN
jgi:hypothetical protein